jgi:uncharacterized OB-fold protein
MSSPERAARAEPPVTETTQPFWEATRQRQLLLQWCSACGRPITYPREVCPFCASSAVEWRVASGFATLYTSTVEHVMPSPVADAPGPYVIALVDLDEGGRLMTNIVNCAVESVIVGMGLQLTWERLSDGRHLPLFEPRRS